MRSEVCFLQLRKFLTSENKYDIAKTDTNMKGDGKIGKLFKARENTSV